MSLSVGAAETSVYCVATLVSYHSSLRYGRVLVVFFLSLLDFVLELFYQHKLFLVISLLLTYIPPLSLQAHCCAPFIFYSLLQCVFSDGTGIIPKCFALLSAGAQPGTSAEVAVHLQELSLKGLRMKQAKPGNTECCGAETSVPRLEGTESVMLNSASAIGFMHLFFAYQDQLAGGA